MDYRELFRNALEPYNDSTPSINIDIDLYKGDIIDIDCSKYLTLGDYGKFHRLLHLNDHTECLINLTNREYIKVIPISLKNEIKTFKKKKFNLTKYIRKDYIYKYSLS